MKISKMGFHLGTVFLSLAVTAVLVVSGNVRADEKTPAFDLDMLYSVPSIIGTTPKGADWSGDGSRVAFLWNDEGHAFREVWAYSIKSKELKPLTSHAKSASSDQAHSGISEVIWLEQNGNQIAYVLDNQLFMQSNNGVSKRIEEDLGAIGKLATSPDGKYLSFVADGSLWVRSSDVTVDGSTRKLVDRENPKAGVQSYQWSADSSRVVFQLTDNSVVPERDIYYYADGGLQNNHVSRAFPGDETAHFRVGVVKLGTEEIQFYSRPDDKHHIWGYALSEDGSSLFINSSGPLAKEHIVYTYDVASGSRETFYREYDARHLRPDWKVAWAPNDDGLIILTDKDGYLHLYHQNAAGAELRAITSGKWEIADFKTDPTNGWIYFLANKSHLAERQIYRVPVKGGEVERVSPETAGTHQPVFSPDMRHAATFFSNDANPLELYIIDLDDKQTARVTKSPRPEFYKQTWADISYVEFQNHVDGQSLIGRLSLPADYDPTKRYPLIVGSTYSDSVRNQYGGRTSHPTWGLDQYFVARGYIILNVNVRGSWGQGRKHNQGLLYGYGVVDIEDLHSGVKYLVNEGFVDPARVGIWGSSYGGLMTMMSLFKKPGVYAAGIAGAPATDVTHAYPAQMWVMGEPTGEDQPGRYEAQSAKYHTEGLEDPLMIIHGTKDDVVLYSDTITVVEKLIAQEKMFELVTMPGSGHGWDNEGAAERRFSFKKMVEFFDRYLMQDEGGSSQRNN